MKKFVSLFLIVLLSVITGCCVHRNVVHPATRTNHVDELSNSTIALVTRDSDKDIVPFCTGVWVSKNIILTAAHCTKIPRSEDEGKSEEEINYVGRSVLYITKAEMTGMFEEPKAMYVATIIARDDTLDLALLKTDPVSEHPIVKLAGNVVPGDKVRIVGHVKGMYWSYIEGVVSALHAKNKYSTHPMPILQIISAMSLGASGGGAFNENNELIGVASAITGTPGFGIYVHVDHVREFLTRNRISQ